MEWVKKAAAAGKHILCEKPMALTEEQVREMFAAAKKHGVLLEEAYAYRHAQLVQKVKEIVDSGAIGRIRYLESKALHLRHQPLGHPLPEGQRRRRGLRRNLLQRQPGVPICSERTRRT